MKDKGTMEIIKIGNILPFLLQTLTAGRIDLHEHLIRRIVHP